MIITSLKTLDEITEECKISKTTLSKYLKEYE